MSQELNEGSEVIQQVRKDLANIEELVQHDEDLLSDLDPGSLMSVSASQEIHSGPLPHPSYLGAYEHILPGSAHRILTMAEKQADHRMAVESQWFQSEGQIKKQGSIFGLVVALVGMGGAIYLGAIGNTPASIAMGTGTVGGLVTVFVTGNKDKDKPPPDDEN